MSIFCHQIGLLGHHVYACGIKPQSSKCDKIMKWPTLWSATDVRSFLGLVRYIAGFLPKLIDHTMILAPLTTKDAHKNFPAWTSDHDFAFKSIKALEVSDGLYGKVATCYLPPSHLLDFLLLSIAYNTIPRLCKY